MKKITLFSLCLIFSLSLTAQENPTQKFDIGIDIQAFIGTLMGTEINEAEVDLMYRLKLKNNKDLVRIKAGYLGYVGYGFFTSTTISKHLLETNVSGIETTLKTKYFRDATWRFNLGLQRRLTKGAWNIYVGGDVFYWLAQGKTEAQLETRNTLLACTCFSQNTLRSWKAKVHSLGIQPFIGIEATISQSWFLTLEFGVPIATNFGKSFFHLDENQEEARQSIQAVYDVIDIGVIELLDLGVYYRF